MENAVSSLFKPELMAFGLVASSTDDFFQQKFAQFRHFNYVTASFEEALIAREAEYPTGLRLPLLTLAIPHTDVEHIKRPFVSLNRLATPLEFIQMGTDNVLLPVREILILGIKEPRKQVGLLATLLTHFHDPDFVTAYQQAHSPAEMQHVLQMKWSTLD